MNAEETKRTIIVWLSLTAILINSFWAVAWYNATTTKAYLDAGMHQKEILSHECHSIVWQK